MEQARHQVRPYKPADRQAVRDICVATCWMGEYRREAIPDDWLWAEFWTRYFTDKDPSLTWVVERGEGVPPLRCDGILPSPHADQQNDCERDARVTQGQDALATPSVVGYLTGTRDARETDRYFLRMLPGIAWHVLSRGLLLRRISRRPLFSMIRSMRKGELTLPREIAREYPAAWHFDLLPEARGRAGIVLMRTFVSRLRELGVSGVHGRTLSINERVNKFLERSGMTLAHRQAVTMFRHIEPRPIEELTWVMKLR